MILLILLIWGPLLLIALVNTTNVSNPPVEVSIELRLGSFEVNITICCTMIKECVLLTSSAIVINLCWRGFYSTINE